MSVLLGKNISLRALEPEDIDFLLASENNEKYWELSSTQTPFSRHLLENYIENAHQDIYEAKQYRFIICNQENIPVGMIDLFDFNPQHQRVGIGILILDKHQQNGYGKEALELIIDYAFTYLNVHQLYANITADNAKSILLFEKYGFQQVGIKKDWVFSKTKFKDEILFQLIRK
jgi:diamine N-acetyltransferase